jgi:hypothetical protein
MAAAKARRLFCACARKSTRIFKPPFLLHVHAAANTFSSQLTKAVSETQCILIHSVAPSLIPLTQRWTQFWR